MDGGGVVDWVNGNFLVPSDGVLQIDSTVTSITNTARLVNQGVVQVQASFFTFKGGLDNQANFTVNAGQVITVQNNLDNSGGQFNINSAYTNAGAIALSQGYLGGTGGLHNENLVESTGAINNPLVNRAGGTVCTNGGLLALNGTSVQNLAGGYLEATAGSTLRLTSSLLNQGVINPQGGAIDLGSFSLTNPGTITGYGTYKAKEIVNDGRVTFLGGNLNVQATYCNNGSRTTEVRFATANFSGAVTTNAGGVMKNTGSDITFFSTFFNNGTYISDPATNTFNAALALGPAGKLAGGEGDVFIVNADLLSANPNGLDIADATLAFGGGTHNFTLAGTARIGTLSVADGATVVLNGGDLIVGFFGADASQFTTAQTIYYEPALNPDLDGQTYALTGGGSLTVVPEPSTCVLVLLGGVTALAVARRRTCKTLALR